MQNESDASRFSGINTMAQKERKANKHVCVVKKENEAKGDEL